MATAIEPHLPYEYDNPLLDFLWPAYLRGDFAYNKGAYYGGGPIAGDSVAFNLGKLAGLPGALQLWPLAMMWLGGAWKLMRNLELWNDPAMRRRMAIDSDRRHCGVDLAAHRSAQCSCAPISTSPMACWAATTKDYATAVSLRISSGSTSRSTSTVSSHWVRCPIRRTRPGPGSSSRRSPEPITSRSWWTTRDGSKLTAATSSPIPATLPRSSISGEIYLTAGTHTVEVGERNIWGGSIDSFSLAAAGRRAGGRPGALSHPRRREPSARPTQADPEGARLVSARPNPEVTEMYSW